MKNLDRERKMHEIQSRNNQLILKKENNARCIASSEDQNAISNVCVAHKDAKKSLQFFMYLEQNFSSLLTTSANICISVI